MIYPDTRSDIRYCGTVLLQDNLDMTLHYAYWMGREKIDVNINMRISSEGKIEYKAY